MGIRTLYAAWLMLALSVGVARAEIVTYQEDFNLTGTSTPYTGSDMTWTGDNNGTLHTSTSYANHNYNHVRHLNNPYDIDTLIRFDDLFGDADGLVPAGSTINSATLTFTNRSGSGDIDLHRVLVPWSGATVPSGDFNITGNIRPQIDDVEVSTAIIDSASASGADSPYSFDVTDEVQNWALGGLNEGFLLHIASPHFDTTVWSIGGASGPAPSDLAFRPFLTVDFTPPLTPEPASFVLFSVLLTLLAGYSYRRRRRQRLAD